MTGAEVAPNGLGAEVSGERLASGLVRLAVTGPVAVLTLDRPDKLNALTDPMLDDVLAALDGLAGAPEVRVVVLTGAGRAFCAGGDLARRADGSPPPDPVAGAVALRHYARITELLAGMPAVTVAAVRGACAGAGLAWAAACDLRVVAEGAVFASAYLAAGLSGDFGGLRYLARLIGHGAAARWYLLPERVPAEEAARLGLVSVLAADGEFDAAVASTVRRLAGSAPPALRAIKANLTEYAERSLGDYLTAEATRHAEVRASPAAAAAAQAFVARRPRP
jgi:2-(1,2-epoxy-1,2-dihydrophenyl)acetyl-CoA isomerase